MAIKTPIKATFTGSDVTGLAEFQSGDSIGVAYGGTGANTLTGLVVGNGVSAFTAVTDGTNGQVLTTDGAGGYTFQNAGASNVAALTDVTLTNLAHGEILKYDATISAWINAIDAGGISLTDLSASDGITYNSSTGAFTLTDTGVSANTYGSASAIPVITVNANGQITSASTTAVAGVSGVSYNGTSGVLTVTTSAGSSYTADLGVGTSDSPTFTNLTATGNAVIEGNLTVQGTTTTIEATNLAVADNMIYLNDGNTTENIDLGIAGNYNDGTYAHTGMFRDASDGRWKFYDSYIPEPDAATNIDTTHASFTLADVQGSTFYGDLNGSLVNSTYALTLETNGDFTLQASGALNNKEVALTTTDAGQTLDSFDFASYRTAKYVIQGISGSDVHATELLITHDDTTVYTTEYATIFSNSALFTISASIVSTNVVVTVTPANTDTTVSFVRTTLNSAGTASLAGDLQTQSGTVDLASASGTEDLNV